jgi:hypothetical protein
MCKRLLRLRPYFATMEANGDLIDQNLNDAQWTLLSELTKVLEPFMVAQRLLEGEKYVTISLVPMVIFNIRKGLVDARAAGDLSEYFDAMLEKLTDNFNMQWGSGALNTCYDEHLAVGSGNRQVGFRIAHMLGAALDPRTKELHWFGHRDQDKIWKLVEERAIALALEQHRGSLATALANAAAARAITVPDVPVFDRVVTNRAQEYRNILSGPGGAHTEQLALVVGGAAAGNHIVTTRTNVERTRLEAEEAVLVRVWREVLHYKSAPVLDFMSEAGVTAAGEEGDDNRDNGTVWLSNPLTWWRLYEEDYPTLSLLARRVLCVQATSAPSERLFSTSGCTFGKLRASLSPDTAEELIFCQGNWIMVDEYNARLTKEKLRKK